MVNTLVQRGPIIFLKVVEGTEGEIDGVIRGAYSDHESALTSPMNEDNMLNYTRIFETYGDKYRLSPRKTFCGSKIGTDHTNQNIANNEDENEMAKWRASFD